MRIALFSNGELDELAVEHCSMRALRSGDAQCVLQIVGDSSLSILLWSSRRFPLTLHAVGQLDRVQQHDIAPIGGVLLEADDCDLRLEHLHRKAYCLGLSRNGEHCRYIFESTAYVKAKILEKSTQSL